MDGSKQARNARVLRTHPLEHFYLLRRHTGETGSGTNSAKRPSGRSGYWYLPPFSEPQTWLLIGSWDDHPNFIRTERTNPAYNEERDGAHGHKPQNDYF